MERLPAAHARLIGTPRQSPGREKSGGGTSELLATRVRQLRLWNGSDDPRVPAGDGHADSITKGRGQEAARSPMRRVRSLETTRDASIARRHARTIRRKLRNYLRALCWLTRRRCLSGVSGGNVEPTEVVT